MDISTATNMIPQKAFVTGSEMPPLKPDTLRLYSMRMCPYAQRAIIVLAHKNIPHETVNINLAKKPEWFLERNPLGKVPTIQKNDIIVYESLIVCEYLDETYPGEKVVSSDPYQKAKDNMFLERYSKVVTNYYTLVKGKDENAKSEIRKQMLQGFQMIEDELNLRKSKFFGGDKPMLIDFAIWPHMERMVVLGDIFPDLVITKDTFPTFSKWIDSITSVPAVKNSMRTHKIHLEFFESFLKGELAYDIGLEE